MPTALSKKRIYLLLLLRTTLTLAQNIAKYDLALETRTVSPDGFEREAILVNGEFPSPLLKACKDDRILANVSDGIQSSAIEQSTTVHWHGMFQHRTQTEDGAGFVSQCPIIPNNYYVYNFSTAGQTGTFWYHSHFSTQYCDGLRGPLVIYDPHDPLQYLYDVDDDSTVITLADWNHKPANEAFEDKTILAPTPDSILINGKGRYSGGPESDLAVIHVARNKRYRFRFVNLSCFAHLNVSIDNHVMTVIEADGIEHRPLTVSALTIFVAQRYSVVVNTDQKIGNYWLRAVPILDVNGFNASTDITLNKAIFRYNGAPNALPKTDMQSDPRYKHLVEADLVPLLNPGAPGGNKPADVSLLLLAGLSGGTNWTLNGASFFPPSVPVLLQILNGATSAQDLVPSGSVYVLPKNKVIEISIPSPFTITDAHPFHLHGHAFDIVKSTGQDVPNYKNPPRRDVVAIYGGNVTFRFQTDNSGPWLLHCHIDWHFSQGLAVVFAEDPTGIEEGPESAIVPPPWKDLCPEYNKFVGN